MPLPIDISALLAGSLVESERLEFKEGWNPESLLHTLCAFANDFHNLGGGYVIIGVAEKNGHAQMPPVGLDPKRIDAIEKEILNLGHSAIQPFFHPVMEPTVIDGKHILILWATGGPDRPYKSWVTLAKQAPSGRISFEKVPTPSAQRAAKSTNSSASPTTSPSTTG